MDKWISILSSLKKAIRTLHPLWMKEIIRSRPSSWLHRRSSAGSLNDWQVLAIQDKALSLSFFSMKSHIWSRQYGSRNSKIDRNMSWLFRASYTAYLIQHWCIKGLLSWIVNGLTGYLRLSTQRRAENCPYSYSDMQKWSAWMKGCSRRRRRRTACIIGGVAFVTTGRGHTYRKGEI